MTTTSLVDALKSANLLPSSIIPDSFTPTIQLSVKFPSGLAPERGSLARVSQIAEQPVVSISSTSNSSSSASTYAFMMIDPDAPTPDDPKFAYWRHWVITSIPSTVSPTDDITSKGKTLTQYLAPGPKDESGPHRYLFLLFEEKEGETMERAEIGGEEFVERRSFRAEELVAKKSLKLVGVQWMRGVGDGWNGGKDEL